MTDMNNSPISFSEPPLSPQDKNNGKNKQRARFFVRTNSKKELVEKRSSDEGRHLLPMCLLFACFCAFLNISHENGPGSSISRGLADMHNHAAAGGLNDIVPQQGHGRLRAISSLYNKNSNPLVKVIKDEEWQEHAYLPLPEVEAAQDDHIWPPTDVDEEDEEEKEDEEKAKLGKQAKQAKEAGSEESKQDAVEEKAAVKDIAQEMKDTTEKKAAKNATPKKKLSNKTKQVKKKA